MSPEISENNKNALRANFAPVEPLQRSKETARNPQSNASSLSAFFREIYQDLIVRDEQARSDHLETGRTIGNLIAGKLSMKRDPMGGGFVFVQPTEDRSNYPLFPQNSITLQSKWIKAKIECAARCIGTGYKAAIQSDLYNTIAKNYFRDIFDSEYELQEILSAQMWGTYITRFGYDDRLNQIATAAPIVQDKQMQLFDGFASCKSCSYAGKPDEFKPEGEMYPACPKCGGYKLSKMLDPVLGDAAEVIGQRRITQGDLYGELLDFPACNYDIRRMAHKSGFFIYRRRMPARVVRELYGGIELQSASGSFDLGFEIMDSLTSRGGNIEGYGASDIGRYANLGSDEVEMIEMWLKPEFYTGFTLDREEETLAGVIPADTPLEKIFPDGICVVGFNDMNFQVGIYAETPAIVSGVYFLQPFSGIGKGVSDAVDIARDLNEIHSMAMAGLKRYGASGVFYDKSTLSPSDVKKLFKPNQATPVDLSKNPHINNINQAIGQITTNPVNPVLPAYAVQLSNLLNMAFLTGEFAQGMTQDVDIDTLGGQQLAHAKAEEQKGAIMTMKVYHRENSAEKIIELFRKHIKLPRFYSSTSADRQFRTKGRFIKSEDLTEMVKFDAVPGSEQPVNSYEKKIAAQTLVEKAGGLAALASVAEMYPKLTSWYVAQHGIEIPLIDEREMQLVCLARIENIKELSDLIVNPQIILASLENKLKVREAGNIVKAEFLSSVLDDDEVSEWNPVAQETVNMLIERHYEMEAEGQFRNEKLKQDVGIALQAEAQNAAMAMQQRQMAQRAGAAQGELAQNLMLQAAQMEADEAVKERDFEREGERDERNHNRTLEIESGRNQAKTKSEKNL